MREFVRVMDKGFHISGWWAYNITMIGFLLGFLFGLWA